jgi:hypothetical protein
MKTPRRSCFSCGAKIYFGKIRCPSCGANYSMQSAERKQQDLRETEETVAASLLCLSGPEYIVYRFAKLLSKPAKKKRPARKKGASNKG